ncbi:hypothetical protein HDV57DRAFT_53367 [Trichoderma longibrachiatum]
MRLNRRSCSHLPTNPTPTSTSSSCIASVLGRSFHPLKLDSDAVLISPHLPAIHHPSPLFSSSPCQCLVIHHPTTSTEKRTTSLQLSRESPPKKKSDNNSQSPALAGSLHLWLRPRCCRARIGRPEKPGVMSAALWPPSGDAHAGMMQLQLQTARMQPVQTLSTAVCPLAVCAALPTRFSLPRSR